MAYMPRTQKIRDTIRLIQQKRVFTNDDLLKIYTHRNVIKLIIRHLELNEVIRKTNTKDEYEYIENSVELIKEEEPEDRTWRIKKEIKAIRNSGVL